MPLNMRILLWRPVRWADKKTATTPGERASWQQGAVTALPVVTYGR